MQAIDSGRNSDRVLINFDEPDPVIAKSIDLI